MSKMKLSGGAARNVIAEQMIVANGIEGAGRKTSGPMRKCVEQTWKAMQGNGANQSF